MEHWVYLEKIRVFGETVQAGASIWNDKANILYTLYREGQENKSLFTIVTQDNQRILVPDGTIVEATWFDYAYAIRKHQDSISQLEFDGERIEAIKKSLEHL